MRRSRRLFLVIAIILAVLIIVVSIFAIVNRQNSNKDEQFNAIYNEAQAKYDEGMSLKELNASLSQESFRQAQEILVANKDAFEEGTEEDQQIEELLAKVNSEVTGGAGGESSTATEVDKSESKLLSYEIDNAASSYFAQNEDFVYFLDGKGVNRIDKGNNEKEAIIDKSWKAEGGIGVFGSNV